MPRPPLSDWLRSLRLGHTGVKVTGHALADGLRARVTGDERNWQPIADELAVTLAELKGPALKLGQTLSMWRDALPAPIQQTLATLRDDVEPIPWSRIRRTMHHELGQPPEQAFDWIDPTPLACASLGQVHRARLPDGTDVVVKARYPDMPAICEADLRQLGRLLPLGRLLGLPAERLDAVHTELARAMRRELDYDAERATLTRFRARYRERNDIVLPRPIDGYCGRAMITLTHEAGESLSTAQQWPAATRNQLAATLVDWAATSFLIDGELHADPHPGNFGFRRDGRLVVYDFGCTVTVTPALADAYATGFRAIQDRDIEGIERAMQMLGSRRTGTPAPWSLHREITRIVGPAVQPGTHWDFGDGQLHREAMALTGRLTEWLGELQPPAEAVLINRTLDGHYWTLHALGAELDLDALLSPRLRQRGDGG